MEAPQGCVLPPTETMLRLEGGVHEQMGEQEQHALCSPHMDEGSCQGLDRTSGGPAVNIEAILSEAFKLERTSAGGGSQEATLPARIKSPRRRSPGCTEDSSHHYYCCRNLFACVIVDAISNGCDGGSVSPNMLSHGIIHRIHS